MLQPGDKVWIPATASIVFPSGDVWFTDRGGFNIDCVEDHIPDVPNLPAIARFLADHPETVDALEKQMHQSFGISGETKSSQLAVGFLKAMRGEGGHDAG